jgi:gamma-glutamyltranspeptidase / glutathione hydrolase
MAKNKGAVSAGHVKTAEAAKLMLEQGGNAFDAAIAAGLASSVVEFSLTSLAGGGFLLAHTNKRENILFDFFTQTPRNKNLKSNPDFYPLVVDFGDTTQEFHIGLGSMAVPGNIAGYFHVHKKLGSLPFSVVAEPAIEYARRGVELNDFQFWCLSALNAILTKEETGKKIFTKDGILLRPGDIYKIPDLANTLEYLVKEGVGGFYRGELRDMIIRDSEELGGYLTKEDFENYKVIERKPLEVKYNGNKFITNPPPSSGGALIAFALELLEGAKIGEHKFGSFEHLKTLSEIMEFTNLARKDGYDKNIYNSDVAQKFLSKEHIEKYRELLNTKVNKWGSTTHLSVVDAMGNAASMTTSNGEGSGYFIPGTGIMMNNMLGEEDLNPHGFHKWQEDVRISSMMSPTMVLKDDRPELVLGSGGSNRIRTAILQVISNVLDFDMHIKDAVNSPRIHWERNNFNIEPGFRGDVVGRIKGINKKDEIVEFSAQNMFFGGVHSVTKENGSFDGAGDLRRGGISLIV